MSDLEVLARLDVEVRLGLVEQEDVGIAQEARRQADELALAAGEDTRRLREIVVVETDVGEQRAGAALEAGAAGAGPAREHVLLPAQQARDPVEVVALLAELPLDLRELVLELREVGPRVAERRCRVAVVAFGLLRQERDDEPAPLRHLAGVGDLLAGEDAKQRRLAAAVRPDHAQAGAAARCRSRARGGSSASRSSCRCRVRRSAPWTRP